MKFRMEWDWKCIIIDFFNKKSNIPEYLLTKFLKTLIKIKNFKINKFKIDTIIRLINSK